MTQFLKSFGDVQLDHGLDEQILEEDGDRNGPIWLIQSSEYRVR